MLWNIPKNQFWSNGVEWMFHNFGTLKQCIPARNTSFASFYLLKVSEMLRNTPKHHFRSNGVEWILHNFGTPKQCIQSQNTSVASFYPSKVSEIRWNTPKHHFGSNGDVSQLWYLKIVHSGSDASFASFTCWRLAKSSESLPNIIFGPMEMIHNFGTPK
jgi:hypothetical protein